MRSLGGRRPARATPFNLNKTNQLANQLYLIATTEGSKELLHIIGGIHASDNAGLAAAMARSLRLN